MAHLPPFVAVPVIGSAVRLGSSQARSLLLRRALVAKARVLMVVSVAVVAASIAAAGVEVLESAPPVLVAAPSGEMSPGQAVAVVGVVVVANMVPKAVVGAQMTGFGEHSKVGREVRAGFVEAVRGCKVPEMMVVGVERVERRSSRCVEPAELTVATGCFLHNSSLRFQHLIQLMVVPVVQNPGAVATSIVGLIHGAVTGETYRGRKVFGAGSWHWGIVEGGLAHRRTNLESDRVVKVVAEVDMNRGPVR